LTELSDDTNPIEFVGLLAGVRELAANCGKSAGVVIGVAMPNRFVAAKPTAASAFLEPSRRRERLWEQERSGLRRDNQCHVIQGVAVHEFAFADV
jgi:hypothetical protein